VTQRASLHYDLVVNVHHVAVNSTKYVMLFVTGVVTMVSKVGKFFLYWWFSVDSLHIPCYIIITTHHKCFKASCSFSMPVML